DGQCLLLMEQCVEMFGSVFCEESQRGREVVALQGGVIKAFEDVLPTPPVKVAINEAYNIDAAGKKIDIQTAYYVEFSGPDAVAAWKTIKLKIPMSGLEAKISARNVRVVGAKLVGEPDGAEPFDPTPGRVWKLADARWSLTRGLTAEILDVYAGQLD